jgi:predicted Fe-Mo cluster-binding NifX family protein
MKIALPTHHHDVDEHFGHCEFFTVFTVNDRKEIQSKEIITSPAGCGCKSNIALTLAQTGVKLMLAGNMGQGAVNVLNRHGIKVLRGCQGDVKTVTEKWLMGSLQDSGLNCDQHQHDCEG